jgi:hypothetical protein
MAKPISNTPARLPDLFNEFDVFLIETRGKVKTETLKGTLKAISINHACQMAKKKYGIIRNSQTRTVEYVARAKKKTK